MKREIQNPEVVVVTGASAGVGRATVRRFAQDGARIGLLARGIDGLRGAERDVQQADGEALVVTTDVSVPEEVEAAAATVEDRFGPIDIWINNAMVSVFAPVKQLAADEVHRVTDVTYLGAVYGTMAALRRMLPRNRGTIVQVGSALAYRSIPLQAAYCGAKHALIGFTESLRCELLHDRSQVQVTVVQLPALNTPQFDWVRMRLPRHPQPVPPIYEPEVAAEAIYWAAHHPRRELKVGGPTLLAIYGDRIAPGVLDHYLAWTGYEAQQTSEPVDPNRQDNLFAPVAGDHGASGSFGDRAHKRSLQLWANTHPLATLIASALSASLLYKVLTRR